CGAFSAPSRAPRAAGDTEPGLPKSSAGPGPRRSRAFAPALPPPPPLRAPPAPPTRKDPGR
ncbi:hypothetical protein P7K49_013516, partial [Saguinus oedipus]